MKTIVFEFVPNTKSVNVMNNSNKSRKRRKKSNKDTSLRASYNNSESSNTTNIKTVTITKEDYHKLITEYNYRNKLIEKLNKQANEQYDEILRLKSIIKDIKGTIITMCDNIK